MTERFHSLTVALTHDIREDDVEALMNAIRCLQGVVAVEGIVADPVSMMAEARALQELRAKLTGILFPKI